MRSHQSIAVWSAIAASLAFFIASLGMPALEFDNHEPVTGVVLFFWGWWGLLTFDFPWFANPLYFAAIASAVLGKRATGQILSGLAFAIGLLSLTTREWWFNEGSATPVEKLGPAFYFWMASFLVLFMLPFFKRKPADSGKDRVDAQRT